MYDHLLALDPVNKETMKVIQDALFAVCLDNYSTSEDVDASHRVFFHGGPSGRNRWFDKALSFIFMSNGRAGCSGEVGREATCDGRCSSQRCAIVCTSVDVTYVLHRPIVTALSVGRCDPCTDD